MLVMKSLVLRSWVPKQKDYTTSNVILWYQRQQKHETGKKQLGWSCLRRGQDESPARNRVAFGRVRAAELGPPYQCGRECRITHLPLCSSIPNNLQIPFYFSLCQMFSFSILSMPDFSVLFAQDFVSLYVSSCITFLLCLFYYSLLLAP